MNLNRCALETTCVAWQFINWEKVKQSVKSVQSRIVKAIKEGRHNKVKSLQWLLTQSFSAKLLAVRRVTQNAGKKTAGTDGILWKTRRQKMNAAKSLRRNGYKARPLRRVYILKKNGKKRPLGIPTMFDRAMQALYLMALDPVAETNADPCSYGFRNRRNCADAIARCYIHLSRNDSPTWILEGDIKGCFDHINHQWLLDNIPIDTLVLKQWLKSGFIEGGRLFPSTEGTPQGGIISPTLANMTLDGLEYTINRSYRDKIRGKGITVRNRHKIHLIRYADDFIVTADSPDILQDVIKPAIEQFLSVRGLTLSSDKTKISHIEKGFDFLGQNIRKYKGKLIIKPSESSYSSITAKIKAIVRKNYSIKPGKLIVMLNPVIRGWCNYHKHVVSKKTFNKLDNYIFRRLWHWAKRQHQNKPRQWITDKYFKTITGPKWLFSGLLDNNYRVTLYLAWTTPIVRHVLIKGEANPFDTDWEEYFTLREWKRLNPRSESFRND